MVKKNHAGTTLFVADIFCSIQGEGKNIGIPSLFLRLGICNLSCSWCDTPYTWKQGMTDYRRWDLHKIIAEFKKLSVRKKITNIVITGGEPMLQQVAIIELLKDAFFEGKTIEFETNGSMPLNLNLKKLIKSRSISFNISPKLLDSGNKIYPVQIYPNSILKFVYCGEKSEKLIDRFMEKITFMGKIYIMPEGTTIAQFKEKQDAILDYCYRRGYCFTPRLQIALFGDKRAT